MRIKYYFTFFILINLSIAVSGNDKKNIGSAYKQTCMEGAGKLLSWEYINTIPASEINNMLPEKEEFEGNISHIPKYDIDLYRIIYSSIFQGKIVSLSGLIIVPKKKDLLPHLQYHHGTMLPYPSSNGEGSLDVPSLYNGKKITEYKSQYETRLFGNYFASAGYLVSLPDYIGYGESSSYEHSYSVNTRLAEQSVDMILATQDFCKKMNINIKNEVYLTGWSEGGAASMATQKLIERQYNDKIKVVANAPLAGFYNVDFYANQFIDNVSNLKEDMGDDLDVLIWTFYAMNKYADGIPLSNDEIFKYNVTNQLDVLKNRPSSIPVRIFQNIDKKKKKILIDKFKKNSLISGWKPLTPIYFHHGTDDDIVYYNDNVELTVGALKKKGANVDLITYKKHDHYSLALLYFLNVIDEFKVVKSSVINP